MITSGGKLDLRASQPRSGRFEKFKSQRRLRKSAEDAEKYLFCNEFTGSFSATSTEFLCDLGFSSFPPHYTQAAFFFGTLAPFFRASESPIAIACLRLFTAPPFPPLPERSVPFFFLRIALATVLPAALPYFRLDFFLVGIESPVA